MLILYILAATSFLVEVEPQVLAPGEPVRITVQGVPAGATVTGTFLDRDLTFLPVAGGPGRVALSGVDLGVEPGAYRLEIAMQPPGEEPLRRRLDLRVEPQEYPTERLKVNRKYVEPPPEVSKRIARETTSLKALWRKATPEFLFDGKVMRPLAEIEGRNFGRRRIFNGQPRSPHSGTDISAPEGTPVEAAAAGVVALAEDHYFSGKLVVLDHGGGVYTVYAHLSAIEVEVGDRVSAGSRVGRVGATGRVTGPHLHWGAKVGGARVNPDSLLKLLHH